MRIVSSWIAVAVAVLMAFPALAQPNEAMDFLRARHSAVDAALAVKAQEESAAALSKAIDGLLDYRELSESALSDHWEDRSPAERDKFVSLLQQLVERSYKKSLRSTAGYKVEYVDQAQKRAGMMVHTLARSTKNRRAPAVAIDYMLAKKDGVWRVLDITTDGVSMVRNYRSQFNRILRKDGWEELIRRMEERLGGEGELI